MFWRVTSGLGVSYFPLLWCFRLLWYFRAHKMGKKSGKWEIFYLISTSIKIYFPFVNVIDDNFVNKPVASCHFYWLNSILFPTFFRAVKWLNVTFGLRNYMTIITYYSEHEMAYCLTVEHFFVLWDIFNVPTCTEKCLACHEPPVA